MITSNKIDVSIVCASSYHPRDRSWTETEIEPPCSVRKNYHAQALEFPMSSEDIDTSIAVRDDNSLKLVVGVFGALCAREAQSPPVSRDATDFL